MRFLISLCIAIAALGILASGPALAFEPLPGCRAYPITGEDLVSGKTVSLEDLRGKWVILHFWASWCGPCVYELPEIMSETKRWRERDDFAIYTVTPDDAQTVSEMRKLIRREHIDFPVVWFGPEDAPWGSHDYNVPCVPLGWLIDPQGTIVTPVWGSMGLSDTLGYWIDTRGPQPPVYADLTGAKMDDGHYQLTLRVNNPDHRPLQARLEVWRTVQEYRENIDGKWTLVSPAPADKEPNFSIGYPVEGFHEKPIELSFDEFGNCVKQIDLPALEDFWYLQYNVKVIMPGSEHLNNGDGYWVIAGGENSGAGH